MQPKPGLTDAALNARRAVNSADHEFATVERLLCAFMERHDLRSLDPDSGRAYHSLLRRYRAADNAVRLARGLRPQYANELPQGGGL